MELKEPDCVNMKNVRSSQPCISMNFCTEFSKARKFFHVSIVKNAEVIKVINSFKRKANSNRNLKILKPP